MKFILGLALASLALAAPAAAQTEVAATIPLATQTASASWQLSTKPISAWRLAATSGEVGGFFMVFDATSVPADGPVTPVFCRPLGPGSSVSMVFTTPVRFTKGLALVFSTTGCYIKTASATAFFEASPR